MRNTSTVTSYNFDKETGWRLDFPHYIEAGTRVLCLYRVSSAKQLYHDANDEADIPMQRLRCREFAEQNGWTIVNKCPEIKEASVPVGRYRDNNGGLLFFRPIALYPFAKVSVRIKEHYDKSYSQIIEAIPNGLLWIQNRLWKKVIWDDVAKKMVMGNATQIELMLLYIVAPELLTVKEKQKMIDNLKSIWDEPDATVVQERLDGIIRGDEYV